MAPRCLHNGRNSAKLTGSSPLIVAGGVLLELTSPLYGVQVVATMPPLDPTVAPQSPTALTCASVDVPKPIPDTPDKRFQPKADHAVGTSSGEDFRQPAVIPFGGRRQFGVYQDRTGNYRILTSLEASTNADYQLATGAVLSVLDFAPISVQINNQNLTHNTIQLEREQGDAQDTAKIRATGLSVLPCDKIQKELATPPSCDSTMRHLPQLQAVANGKVVATRNVESKFGTLGSGTKKSDPEYDGTISYYADAYEPLPFSVAAETTGFGQLKVIFPRFMRVSRTLESLTSDSGMGMQIAVRREP